MFLLIVNSLLVVQFRAFNDLIVLWCGVMDEVDILRYDDAFNLWASSAI